MKKYIFGALAALLLTDAQAQQVQTVTIGDNLNYGITYNLPTTAVQVTVTAHCTQVKAGAYAPYAEKYLGLTDVPQTDGTEWEIEQIAMTSIGLANRSKTYHIMFPEKGALPTFYLTDEGQLCGINKEPEVQREVIEEKPESRPKVKYKPSELMTSDILKAGSKAKQAELVAEEIFNIRESRSDLIKGEADNTPNDGQQLALMLDNLSAQEEALLSFFVGTKTELNETKVYTYVPDDQVDKDVFFRFSKELGFTSADDMAGAPYYITVSLLEDNRIQLPEDPKERSKMEIALLKASGKGIAHCIPGKARVSISTLGAELTQLDMMMAQFGHVEQLPQMQFTDKKKVSAALLNTATGALKLFEQTGLE